MGKKADKKPSKKRDKTLKIEKKEKKTKRKDASKKTTKLSPKTRLEMVATAAYYIAEEHGFTPGRAETDWLEAERQIEESLKKSN